MKPLTPNQDVLCAMQVAANSYPGDGYCYHRAKQIQALMHKGSVYTFSDKDYNYSFQHSPSNIGPCMRNISIPYDTFYRGEVNWAYHTVYELDGIVYTYELNGFCAPFRAYTRKLQELNEGRIVVRAEKMSYH